MHIGKIIEIKVLPKPEVVVLPPAKKPAEVEKKEKEAVPVR